MVPISSLERLDYLFFPSKEAESPWREETLLNNYVFQANKFCIGYDLVCR